MRTFAVLGLALLCLNQVSCEKGDLLGSLLNEKAKELKSEKLPEPEVFLAADPTPAPYDCNANTVMVNGTTLMKNTLDIISETFSVVYTARYPDSGSETCSFTGTFGNFRCLLWTFNELKDDIDDVKSKVRTYSSNASDLLKGISAYFKHCFIKNV